MNKSRITICVVKVYINVQSELIIIYKNKPILVNKILELLAHRSVGKGKKFAHRCREKRRRLVMLDEGNGRVSSTFPAVKYFSKVHKERGRNTHVSFSYYD